ncbi:MAG: iron-sulfur cluster repair di-iron protein [Ginsengibacter sp.]
MIHSEINETIDAETVGSVAAKDYRKAEIFKKLGIDFCCGGNTTLKKASEEAGISEEELRSQLAACDLFQRKTFSQDFNKWKLDFLTDYIINTHHLYIKENVPVISDMALKVATHHEKNHPELTNLQINIRRFLEDMLSHMKKEEQALFPKIKQLVSNKNNAGEKVSLQAGCVKSAVWAMQREHETSGEDLQFFRKLTHDYLLPEDACNSYKFLFEKMKEFEEDLIQHIHLENNILFPKAVQLEEDLVRKN